MKSRTLLPTLALLVALAALTHPTFGQAWSDPEKAAAEDPDFKVQGEYEGVVKGDDGADLKVGAQVIAMGKQKFRCVGYRGGLPGAGWQKEEGSKVQAEAVMADGKADFTFDKHKATLHNDGTMVVFNKDGGEKVGSLKRIERKSPTLGAKAPAGSIILFDGTKETFEKQWAKGARMSEDNLLMEGCSSVPTFQGFKLHIEFRIPYMPNANGQGRGNSGCYMQGRYEVQMLDSFGLEGKNNECGGIYTIKDPDVNMALPPLTWQTYDVEYTPAKFDASGKKVANAHMTVLHNGVKIQDNVELDHATTASPKKEGPDAGPIYLQNHGNPVRYRNIWVKPME